MRMNLLEALSDNITVDKSKCVYCGVCVDTCILDNLRLKLAPCRQACPLETNVQGYVQKVLRGDDDGAREILRETLIFPEILGRICPAPCEGGCHRAATGDSAVSARAIKRYLTEGQTADDIPVPTKAKTTGRRVAVIGSGPAGLQAAHDLALAGHGVTVFEAETEPGGALRWAIPEFRLPTEVLNRELTLLEKLDVEFRCGVRIGEQVSLKELKNDFDALIVASGCPEAAALGLDEEPEGVVFGLDILKGARSGAAPELSGKVVVIGGGNVAVDAAQTALRLGAGTVTVISLETADELPAFPEEVARARAEGVAFEHSWGPTRFTIDNGRVSGVELQRCTAVFDADGAFKPQFDSCTLNTIEASTVIVAIGQRRGEALFQGLTDIDSLTLRVGEADIFVAGDCHTGPSSVVAAMAQGRRAAESVLRLLAGEHLSYGRSYAGPVETGFDIDITVGSDAARAVPPHKTFEGRGDFTETEGCLDEAIARTEAGRCHSCGQPFGKYRTCWFCLPCEVECPEDAMWVEIPYLLR